MEASKRISIGIVAAIPFLIPQLIYLSDIDGWNVALSYGLFGLIVPSAVLGCLFYGLVESHKRRDLPLGTFQFPWFSISGFLFLITFFSAGEWARPIVLKIPQWCRVYQVIVWDTTKPDETYGGTHSYVLVFTGRGNIDQHKFTSGYLNWTGEQPAGFSDIGAASTFEILRDRIQNSGISDEDVRRITGEIWSVIEQVSNGSPIMVRTGFVDQVKEAPFDHEETVLGASIWMALLLGSFQIISGRSFP